MINLKNLIIEIGETIYSKTITVDGKDCVIKVKTGPSDSRHVFKDGQRTSLSAIKSYLSSTDLKDIKRAIEE